MRLLKRNRWIVNRFQVSLLGYNLGYLLISIVGVAVVLFLPLVMQMRDPTLSPNEREGVAENLLLLDSRVWPALFLAFCFFALHSILVSHRIAGPLVRFRAIFDQVAAGRLNVSAKLRDRDYLHDEALALEAMIDALRYRETNVQTCLEGIREDLDDLARQTLDGYGRTVLERSRNRVRVTLSKATDESTTTEPVALDEVPAVRPSGSPMGQASSEGTLASPRGPDETDVSA